MASLLLIGTLVGSSIAQTRSILLNDPTEPGSVIVFPKFIRGQVTVDGVPLQPRSEFAVGVTCPPNTGLCAEKVTYKIKFHWVCGTDENPLSSFICREQNFEAFVTMNGKIIFNTEGTTAPGNFVASTPPCPRGYLIGWMVDLFDQPIKFDGLIGEAVLRETSTAVMAYKGYTIKADPALPPYTPATSKTPTPMALGVDPLFGTPTLVFDGGPGHYLAPTGVLISDVEYDKTTAATATTTGSHSTNLTLLTLDTRSNQPNFPTFVPLKFWSAQEDLHSTSVDFVCWVEIGLLGFDPDLTSGQVGSRKGVMVAGPAFKLPIGGVFDTQGRVTLLGLVDTLEGPTAASPACLAGTGGGFPQPPCLPIERTSGNERSFMYEVYNDSVPVPTTFVPFPF
jgi:hypothetical protein